MEHDEYYFFAVQRVAESYGITEFEAIDFHSDEIDMTIKSLHQREAQGLQYLED